MSKNMDVGHFDFLGVSLGTRATRRRIGIPGPQKLGTGGTLSAVENDHRDRGHPP